MLDQILPLEDADIAKVVAARASSKQNIKVVTGTRVEEVKARQGLGRARLGRGAQKFDYLCIAAGRAPDIEALGLDAAGVKTGERGLIEVDERMRTSADGVWAIGDLVHGPALAHKASDEGIIAVEDAAGLQTAPARLRRHPRRHVLPRRRSRASGSPRRRRRSAARDVVVGKFPMGGVGAATVYGDRTGHGEDRRRRALRRAARRAHRRRARDRDDRRAGRREAARGRLRGGRAHGAPAPDVLRGGDGGRPRHRRAGSSTHDRRAGFRDASPVFYFDLGSPYSYLAAERINSRASTSRPCGSRSCSAALFKIHGRDSWAERTRARGGHARRSSGARREYGLPPIRWPDPWPGNTLFAMRAATFATQIGKAVSFSLAGVPAGVRGRPRPERSRQRAARRGRLRAAPERAREGRRDAEREGRAARGDRRGGGARRDRRADRGRRRRGLLGG